MVAIDANVLVRRITNDHPILSPKALKLITIAKPGSLLLDRLIIEEVAYVLSSNYDFSKDQVSAVLRSLVSEEVFTIPDRDMVELTIRLFETEKPLSFEDCWLLALKKSGKVTNVVTFDDNLLKRT